MAASMKLYYDKRLKDPTYYIQQGFRNGKKTTTGSLTLAHSRNSQMSFMYGFFFVKFLLYTVVCVVIVI